jgi:hypothetical protein
MLKIYDKLDDIPESLREHYHKRADGKFEPDVEGINSIGGLLAKRDEVGQDPVWINVSASTGDLKVIAPVRLH